MSGPIVRKYGFPNFEAIFGERELKHGADEPKPSEVPASEASDKAKTPGEAEGKAGPKKA